MPVRAGARNLIPIFISCRAQHGPAEKLHPEDATSNFREALKANLCAYVCVCACVCVCVCTRSHTHVGLQLRHLPGHLRTNGNQLQYSCLGNPMDRGTWWGIVRGVSKESDMTEHTHINTNGVPGEGLRHHCISGIT